MPSDPGRTGPDVVVTVAVDTEEDDWGVFVESGATCRNIARLPELQDLFDTWGAKPTYLVTYPPLTDRDAVPVLGELAARGDVEIGAHCHPWNTPPQTAPGREPTMMQSYSREANQKKIHELTARIQGELDVRPITFRAGRWGYGVTVSTALADEGYRVDASVSPFVDWSDSGGPDFRLAPHHPYRFRPEAPLQPDSRGPMVELPTTIGFGRWGQDRAARWRRALQRSVLSRFRMVGLLDRAGLLALRWLSPETSTRRELVALADAWVSSGHSVLALTFHSSSLRPGATPFVRDEGDRARFLDALGGFLEHCARSGYSFSTLGGVGRSILGEG